MLKYPYKYVYWWDSIKRYISIVRKRLFKNKIIIRYVHTQFTAAVCRQNRFNAFPIGPFTPLIFGGKIAAVSGSGLQLMCVMMLFNNTMHITEGGRKYENSTCS